jgi:hypothetical protein
MNSHAGFARAGRRRRSGERRHRLQLFDGPRGSVEHNGEEALRAIPTPAQMQVS